MTGKSEFIVTDDPNEAEKADMVVCILAEPELRFPDNLVGHCTQCGRLVQFRPHAPKTPPKVCIECVMPKMQEELERGETVTNMITPTSAIEVLNYLAKKQAN